MRVSHLWKSYGTKQVLRNLSFEASAGVTCLQAPSGGGKTTLTRILMGLEQPDRGTVEGIAGARLSAVFQEDRLLNGLSAVENLCFVAPEGRTEAEKLLRRLNLPVGKQPVREFSGGMRRRVALARALMVPWDLLILDEPFTGLDEENRQAAIRCLMERMGNGTVLIASHDPRDVRDLSAGVVSLL